jgi:hypothetical protein
MTAADPDTDYLQRARDFVSELAAAAPEIARQRELPEAVVADMIERGFFRMLLARSSGGAEFLRAQGGYSCAVVEVDLCRGHDRVGLRTNDDRRGPAGQARQTLRDVEAALAEAGSILSDIVRVRYDVPNGADWPAIVPVPGEVFGTIRPAATHADLRSCGPPDQDPNRGDGTTQR